MGTKFTTLILTTTFFNFFCWIRNSFDTLADFTPLISSISSGKITAYDFFLFFSIFTAIIVSRYFNIKPFSVLRYTVESFLNLRMQEMLLLVAVLLLTHFFACPFIHRVLEEPISVIRDFHESVRKTVILSLPLIWILSLELARQGISITKSALPGRNQTQPMPQPPKW